MYKYPSFKTKLIIGSILLCISLWIYSYNKSFRENAVKTIGVIIEVESSIDEEGDIYYFPIYEYSTKSGLKYQHKPITSISSAQIGDKTVIYYNESSPEKALVGESNFDFFAFITLALGFVLLLLVLIRILKYYNNKRKFFNLKTSGKKIIIPYRHVYVISFNDENSSYYRVIAQWYNKRDNKVYLFNSIKLKENPKKEVRKKDIKVYVHRNNLKKQIVDLTFLNEFNG